MTSARKSVGPALVALSGFCGVAGTAAAQTAAPVELPDVVVTTASPVAKPKPAAKKKYPAKGVQGSSQPKAASASANKPQADQPPPPATDAELQALPGTLITDDNTFVATGVTTSREIVSREGQTITDTLMTKPGISGSTFAAGANRPIIRGLDNNRVRVQEDGIGSHDVSALSEDHAVPIDPFAADRVEVVRGPATLRYGSQAIGGVVAVENERVPTFAPERGFSGEIIGAYSSVDDGGNGAFKATAASNGIVVHADAFKRRSEDYDTPHGKQLNTYVDSDGYSVGASLVGTEGFAGVAYTRFNSLYGIPGEEAVEENSRIDMKQDKLLSKGEWRTPTAGIDAIRYWFGATDYSHNEVVGEGEIGSRFTNREQEGRVEIQHSAISTGAGILSGAVGAQIGNRNTSGISFEGDNLLEPAHTQTAAGFIFEELHVTDPLRLQAAMRVESNSVDGIGVEDPLGAADVAARSRHFTPISGSIGALYELPQGVVARLTGQYVERAPDAAELFSKGAHEATETFEIGNPDLGIETATTVELGFKKARGDFRFDASAYYTRFDGFIFKELTGAECGDTLASCGVDDELKQLVFQQRDATFYGVELAFEYDVAKIWRGLWGIDAQYDFVRAEFTDGENVPRIPPQRLGGGIYYRDANWFLRSGVLHAFDQNKIGFNETPTNGYTLVSAELSYRDKLDSGSLATEYTIGIRGENLADQEVRNHTSFKKDEVLEPGASVKVFGSLKFN